MLQKVIIINYRINRRSRELIIIITKTIITNGDKNLIIESREVIIELCFLDANWESIFPSTYTMRNDYNPLARPYFNCVRQSHHTHRTYAYINKFPRSLPPSFSPIFRHRVAKTVLPPLPPLAAPPDRKCMRVYFARASDADRMQNNGSLPDICGRDCDKYIR